MSENERPKKLDDPWLDIAHRAFNMSTSYMDNNLRKDWDTATRHFQGRHASGSKYLKNSYRYRSKLFRPKTRSAVRNNESAAMAAFFSNMDVVSIDAVNGKDPAQIYSAEVTKQVLQVRLENDIPWFLTVMGAYQDAQVIGVVCSYQGWEYKEEIVKQQVPDPENPGGVIDVDVPVVVTDRPVVDLLPVEHVRIHPAADWRSPIKSSPYVIRLIPMYVADIKARMQQADPKTGAAKWKNLSDGEIQSVMKQTYDQTRSTRENDREDKYDHTSSQGPGELFDFDVAWVHENFVRKDGQDKVFYTLGTQYRLSDPVPIEDIYFTGDRPIVMGVCVVETHKPYPNGNVGISKDVQKELNENVNQRLDNVKLVLNKRFIAKAGAQVDIPSLVRNVPGSVTIASDPDGDVKALEWNDVTSSAYAEQDRLNLDFDDVFGAFSNSTVQSNRQMNETVGGMAMMKGTSNLVQEYNIRTFAETWAEPVLKQLLKLEQKYETDERILAIAGQKAQAMLRYGMDAQLDEMLNEDLTLKVNIGMGSTDPIMRMNLILQGMQSVATILLQPLPGLNAQEVVKEIFGRLGFPDGGRFFDFSEDNVAMQAQMMIQQLQQQLQQMAQELKNKDAELQTKILLERMEQKGEDRRQGEKLAHETKLKALELHHDAQMNRIEMVHEKSMEKKNASG